VRVQPPLVITRPQIDQAVEAVVAAVKQVQAERTIPAAR